MNTRKFGLLGAVIILAASMLACGASVSFTPNSVATTSAPSIPVGTATLDNVCVMGGGHQGWSGSNSPKSFEFATILNMAALEKGLSLEPDVANAFGNSNTTIAGSYIPPSGFQAINDGPQVLGCRLNGRLVIFVLDRTTDSVLPFWKVSYIQLVLLPGESVELKTWENDSTNTTGWIGTPGGNERTYKFSEALASWDGAQYSAPDLSSHIQHLQSLTDDINIGIYNLPEYGQVTDTWTNVNQ